MDGIQIVLLIIIVLALIAIYYSSTYNKIKTEILKINSSESEIDTLLRNKYDLIAKVIVEINQLDDKNLKTFDKLKEEELSSFEFERKLLDYENKIVAIINDNNKLAKNQTIIELNNQISNVNAKVNTIIKYYNDSISGYNALVSKFPTKLIAIITRLKEKRYFDGKNMEDDIVNDFSSLKEKREKILEMFSGTNNYNYCRKLFLKEEIKIEKIDGRDVYVTIGVRRCLKYRGNVVILIFQPENKAMILLLELSNRPVAGSPHLHLIGHIWIIGRLLQKRF